MRYSDDIIEEVRMKNDIVDVISQYVRLTRKGSSYFGLCPFHNEKTPSFSVTPSKQMYYCFGCGAGGNVYNFVMQYENYSFGEALSHLAERAGVELPKIEYSQAARAKAEKRATLLEINKKAAQYFYYQLRRENGKTAHDYLTGRGLSEEMIKKFGLGYSDKYSDDLYKYLKAQNYTDDLLRESGADTSLLREVDGPSGHAVIEINAAGQNRIIVFGGANRRETREYIERVLDTAQPDDWVLLQNEVNLVPEIIRRAHEKGLRVVFNPSPVPENTEKLPLACVSLFVVNEIEAAQLAGTDANADFEDTLTALRAKYPNASVVMTVGADGVLYDGEEGRFQLPAFKVKAVDTTAAGDTFCGYFLAAVCAGKSVQTALQEASAASAIAVSRTGAAPSVPTADEVREFVRRHA